MEILMPNWCFNRVSFCAENEQDVTKLKSIFESETPFNEIIPAPDWKNTPNDKGELPRPREMKKMDGTVIITCDEWSDGTQDDRWYHWNIANWGVKWDIDKQEVDDEDGWFQLEFETPWGPPNEIFEALREKFPDVSISWFYDEPGMGFAGYLPD